MTNVNIDKILADYEKWDVKELHKKKVELSKQLIKLKGPLLETTELLLNKVQNLIDSKSKEDSNSQPISGCPGYRYIIHDRYNPGLNSSVLFEGEVFAKIYKSDNHKPVNGDENVYLLRFLKTGTEESFYKVNEARCKAAMVHKAGIN